MNLERFVQAQEPAQVSADNQVFIDALQKYFRGEYDPLTLDRL